MSLLRQLIQLVFTYAMLVPRTSTATCQCSNSRYRIDGQKATSFVSHDNWLTRSWGCNSEKSRNRRNLSLGKIDIGLCLANVIYACPSDILAQQMCTSSICKIESTKEEPGVVIKDDMKNNLANSETLVFNSDNKSWLILVVLAALVFAAFVWYKKKRNNNKIMIRGPGIDSNVEEQGLYPAMSRFSRFSKRFSRNSYRKNNEMVQGG